MKWFEKGGRLVPKNINGGFIIKSLMKNSKLEKQISRQGTLSLKSIEAWISKSDVPAIDKELLSKVLENHRGEKVIDFQQLKQEVSNIIPVYNRVPQTEFANYGLSGLDYSQADDFIDSKFLGRFPEYNEKYFYELDELGETGKHYYKQSLTDKIFRRKPVEVPEQEIEQVVNKIKSKEIPKTNVFTFESPGIKGNTTHFKGNPVGHSRTFTTASEPEILHVMESQSDWAQHIGDKTKLSPTETRMVDTYLTRQIQENLRYAAENHLTKMRYPTPETAAKIEYFPREIEPSEEQINALRKKYNAPDKKYIVDYVDWLTSPTGKKYEQELATLYEYTPEHKAILKKYEEFPKQYQKLFGKTSKVEIVKDTKGNTWYEVDVPQDYLNQEYLFKKGGLIKKASLGEVLSNGVRLTVKEAPELKNLNKYLRGTKETLYSVGHPAVKPENGQLARIVKEDGKFKAENIIRPIPSKVTQGVTYAATKESEILLKYLYRNFDNDFQFVNKCLQEPNLMPASKKYLQEVKEAMLDQQNRIKKGENPFEVLGNYIQEIKVKKADFKDRLQITTIDSLFSKYGAIPIQDYEQIGKHAFQYKGTPDQLILDSRNNLQYFSPEKSSFQERAGIDTLYTDTDELGRINYGQFDPISQEFVIPGASQLNLKKPITIQSKGLPVMELGRLMDSHVMDPSKIDLGFEAMKTSQPIIGSTFIVDNRFTDRSPLGRLQFKKGGNIQKANLGTKMFQHVAEDMVFKNMDEAMSKIVPKAVSKELSKKVIDKVALANADGTVFRLYEKFGDGSIKVVGQLNIQNFDDFIKPIFVEKINKESKEVSRYLYDAAMAFHNKPLKSGDHLLAPAATKKIQDKYFDKHIISETGGMREGEQAGRVVLLMQPSQQVFKNEPWKEGTAIKLREYQELPEKKPYPKFLEREFERYEDISEKLEEQEMWKDLGLNMDKLGGKLTKLQEGGVLETPSYQDFKIPEQQFVFRHLENEEQAKQFDQDLADLFYREEIKHGQLTKEGRQELQRKYNLSQQQVEDTLDDLLGFGLGEALVADLLQTGQEISIDKVVDKSIDFDKQGGVLKMSFGGAAMRALVPKAAESLTSIVPKIGTSEAQQLLIKSLANGEMTELTLNAIARGKSNELIKALKRTDTFKDLLKGEKVITEADTKILDALFHPGGAPVAAEYLLTGTPGTIKSTGYFLTGLTGVFPQATNDIKKVALKYGDDIMNNGEFANFILNPKFKDMMADMKKAISKTYGKGGETSLDIIMSSPTGLNPKQGNLVGKLLAEGEQELVSNEILKDKRPPKDLFTDNTTFRKGGKINKYSIGAAIKKFAKGLDEVAPIAEKAITKETAEQVFRTSGTSKVIGKATTEHLQKVATATGDKRIQVLADFAVQCRDKGIKLPEEFNKFVDSIFKTPTVISSDTKKIRVGKEKVAEPEIIEWHGLKQERPTFEKNKYKTKTVHTGEFKDKLEFKRTIPQTEQELAELSPKVDEAINSLVKMMNGEEFKLTDTMMDEIYLKSKGMVQTFEDNRANGQKLRQLFSEIEYPTIVKRQLSENYIPPVAPSPELEKFYQASKENLDWYGKIKNASQQYVWFSPKYEGPLGNIEITPLRISPKKKELAVYNTHDGYLSFLPSQIMTKQDRPYVKAYRATIDGAPVKGMPTFNFDEHHSNPLSLMQAEAYLQNPMPTSSMEHVRDYQKNRTKSGSKDSFYDQFLALLKKQHTGKEGIHYADKFSLQDLQRIKALSRSGRFKTMEDLLAYYSKIKAKQLKYFT